MNKNYSGSKSCKPAFSLLELMIVIIIISLVYALTFSSMQKQEKTPKSLNAGNIKSTLQEQGYTRSNIEFFCVDKCSKCFIYNDGDTKRYEGKLSLGDLKAYYMGNNGKLEKVEFGRYQDHPVCLRFKMYRNGSSTQIVLEDKSGIYYLPSLFGEVAKTNNLEEAEELWLKYGETVKDRGEFY